MASNTEIAKQVINAIGGASNVRSVAHCATRLRVMVKDETVIDKNTVENIEKVQEHFSIQVNIKLFLELVLLIRFMMK